MTGTDVQQLLRQAVTNNDQAAMRAAFERLLHGGPDALSPEEEYQTRYEDYVMDMPQSGERIRGRDQMRAMQEAYPTPPTITLQRVVGSGTVWILEGVNDYAGDVWHVVLILELDPEGRVLRDTRYYAKRYDPPAWRASWVEPM
jgi:hypothetical protein